MKKIIAVLCLVPSLAFAQQQQSPAAEQALGQKLMQEINTSLQCSAQVITLRQELDRVQAELKALKEKTDGH